MMVVLVSTSDPGLTIFPTHRTAASFDASNSLLLAGRERPARCARVASAGQACSGRLHARPGRVAEGEPGQLDTQLVEKLAPDVGYTAYVDEAIAAVDEGRAEAAFLLARRRIEDVFAVAKRGEVLPPEDDVLLSQVLSGLLFHPAVTDWLAICRGGGRGDVRGVSSTCRRASSAEPVRRHGEGGDETTIVDAEVERVVIAVLDDRLDDYTLVSEEIGEVVEAHRPPVARARPRRRIPRTRSAASRTSASRWPSRTGRRWTT